MRERESVRTHADFFCSVTKPDALAQIHAALARRKCAHLKRVFSRSNCVLCTHNSLYAHVLDINSFRTFLFLAFYRVQCERSDPLTWARKKGASQTVCEPGVTQAYSQSVLFSRQARCILIRSDGILREVRATENRAIKRFRNRARSNRDFITISINRTALMQSDRIERECSRLLT